MKTDSDFELRYAEVLKKCIKLFDEESQHEKEKISLALKIGEKVNKIANCINDDESEAIFKRLSRDIFKTRKKIITPSKISEYRQLYLNFQSMDIVTSMEKSLMNDVNLKMLVDIALKDRRPKNKPQKDDSPFLTMLIKAFRLLDRFEIAIEDKQPDDNDMPKLVEKLELITEKVQTILNDLQNYRGRGQMDFFKMCAKPGVAPPKHLCS